MLADAGMTNCPRGVAAGVCPVDLRLTSDRYEPYDRCVILLIFDILLTKILGRDFFANSLRGLALNARKEG